MFLEILQNYKKKKLGYVVIHIGAYMTMTEKEMLCLNL